MKQFVLVVGLIMSISLSACSSNNGATVSSQVNQSSKSSETAASSEESKSEVASEPKAEIKAGTDNTDYFINGGYAEAYEWAINYYTHNETDLTRVLWFPAVQAQKWYKITIPDDYEITYFSFDRSDSFVWNLKEKDGDGVAVLTMGVDYTSLDYDVRNGSTEEMFTIDTFELTTDEVTDFDKLASDGKRYFDLSEEELKEYTYTQHFANLRKDIFGRDSGYSDAYDVFYLKLSYYDDIGFTDDTVKDFMDDITFEHAVPGMD